MQLLNSYLRLVRAPAIPTALSNIFLGYLVTNRSWAPIGPLAMLLLASAAIYTAGMVLNDVADLEEDRKLRPDRPLPQGDIPWSTARRLGFGLLVAGVFFAALAGAPIWPGTVSWTWLPLSLAVALTILVVGYDFGVKRLWAGPLVMGLCRALNVLLGASVIGAAVDASSRVVWTPFALACGIGGYVVGISWLARSEAGEFQRRAVVTGVGWMLAGWVWLAGLVWWLPDAAFDELSSAQKIAVSAMLLVVFSPVWVRSIMAVKIRSTKALRGAVTVALLGLILIDASLCFAVAVRSPFYAGAVSLLVVLSLLLGRRAYAT